MSKSKLKRLCTVDPIGMAEEMHRLKAELAEALGKLAEYEKKLETCEKLAQSVMNDLGGTA